MGRKKEERFAANYETYEEIRREKGKFDTDIARETGVSLTSISMWKHGKRLLTRAQAEKIARVLGIPAEKLLEKPEPKEEPESLEAWFERFGREWVREAMRITRRKPHWLWKGEWV